ncbi:Kelch-like protein diablo [Symbiodinium microadriaticum]|uniref:Kelch-like protein diablo n=1 Tax=Symbiodinium microadriaticum TaxID=2951 RepID=A0A1Q9E8W4_SYMMI|nr:Kelch-like protein diablo [Symbiodinium microadriaticum]
MAKTVDAEVLAGYITLGNLEGLRKFAPPSFDWRQPLAGDQIPALVHVITQGLTKPGRCQKNLLKIAEWLLKAGADPTYKIPQHNRSFNVWKVSQKDETKISVPYQGHSAVSYAFAWLSQLELSKGGADWSTDRKYIEDIVALFAGTTAGGNPHGADVIVPQSTVDIWESMRDLTSSHNVIFEASDGEVSAQDQILMVASPVLKAMLESAMKESTSRRIPVKDSSSSGVSLFLDVLYTSSTRQDPDHKTLLEAMDLAHRWQVQGVVQSLCTALQNMIDAKSFVAIAEAAVLKALPTLERACASFGSTNEQVQGMLKKGFDIQAPRPHVDSCCGERDGAQADSRLRHGVISWGKVNPPTQQEQEVTFSESGHLFVKTSVIFPPRAAAKESASS